MTTSTPDALWASRSVRLLHPVAVRCEGVRRVVGREALLAGVDLAVPVGAHLLLVSRPEASASLLLRILAGLARADGGRIQLAGLSSTNAGVPGWAWRVGHVGPGSAIHAWLSPREALQLAGRLADLDGRPLVRRVDASLERYGLAGVADRPMRHGGLPIVQRTMLATAQLTEPEVLLLDEPLRALDPPERSRLLALIGRRQTVILTSRYPSSEAGLVDRTVLLHEGRVALDAPILDLERRSLPLSMTGIEALADLPAAG